MEKNLNTKNNFYLCEKYEKKIKILHTMSLVMKINNKLWRKANIVSY